VWFAERARTAFVLVGFAHGRVSVYTRVMAGIQPRGSS
jgi:hypothetical protein